MTLEITSAIGWTTALTVLYNIRASPNAPKTQLFVTGAFRSGDTVRHLINEPCYSIGSLGLILNDSNKTWHQESGRNRQFLHILTHLD